MSALAITLSFLCLLPPAVKREELPHKPSPEQIEKYRNMSSEERTRLKERWQRFKALPAEDREKILQNVERLKRMKPEALRGLMRRFKELPEDRKAAFHRMLKRAEIPPFMIPRFVRWIRGAFPEDGLKKFLVLPAPQQRESFGQIIGRFKKETIRELVRKKIVPRLFADVMKTRPLADQWRMAIDCLREHREEMKKRGNPPEHESNNALKER